MRRQPPTVNGGAIVGKPNLTIHSAQIEQNGSLFQVDVLLGSLLLVFEGVVPNESDGIDVILIG